MRSSPATTCVLPSASLPAPCYTNCFRQAATTPACKAVAAAAIASTRKHICTVDTTDYFCDHAAAARGGNCHQTTHVEFSLWRCRRIAACHAVVQNTWRGAIEERMQKQMKSNSMLPFPQHCLHSPRPTMSPACRCCKRGTCPLAWHHASGLLFNIQNPNMCMWRASCRHHVASVSEQVGCAGLVSTVSARHTVQQSNFAAQYAAAVQCAATAGMHLPFPWACNTLLPPRSLSSSTCLWGTTASCKAVNLQHGGMAWSGHDACRESGAFCLHAKLLMSALYIHR